jgi:uncharacterized damage-inducible protein DinB
MDMDTLQLFARYNEKTNKNMNTFISKLTELQWDTRFQAYYPSIHSICNHVYITDFHWLKRFSKLRDSEYIKDDIFLNEIRFTDQAFKTQKQYLEKREHLDDIINRFANEVTERDFARNLKYLDSKGTEHNRNFGGLVIHMFNHQTHHRGMVSVYLEMLGIQNDYSNLLLLV